MHRRSFLATSVGVAALAGELPRALAAADDAEPLVISTWDHGIAANAAALKTLASGGSVVDAVEHGVMVTEADPTNLSVGLSGLPDRDGVVTLDACIMAGDGRAGSACFLQGIKHPISLARMVMDKTPHVMIVGAGAERFARENGMKQLPNDLSEAARKAWQQWVKEKNYKPVINIENHDTIGLLARDSRGRMAGACTTSGLAYKIHGRVGDSPIIGAGLFVDDEVGGATCTGLGESVIRTGASTVAVERMRYGATPQEACEEAIRRIVKKHANWKEFQVGILAVDNNGRHGAYALQKGFTYALNNELKTAEAYGG
ncbi:MAG: N(4)-(beta-N-acetylglucosaminyl)-L-asparaginase [Candidatus Kapabacteria bacterium]|nr:N(4)-(beta-N-acetylglucosaminyl)-L-asparaginase [Candidatus Kapabacteria bacterium]